jgi:hypothetical protein
VYTECAAEHSYAIPAANLHILKKLFFALSRGAEKTLSRHSQGVQRLKNLAF